MCILGDTALVIRSPPLPNSLQPEMFVFNADEITVHARARKDGPSNAFFIPDEADITQRVIRADFITRLSFGGSVQLELGYFINLLSCTPDLRFLSIYGVIMGSTVPYAETIRRDVSLRKLRHLLLHAEKSAAQELLTALRAPYATNVHLHCPLPFLQLWTNFVRA